MAALLFFLNLPVQAQYNNPTPRSKQAGQQEGRKTRNSTTSPSNRPNQQFPRSGFNNPTPRDREAGRQPGRKARNNTTLPANRPNQQFPKSGYNNPTPRDRQANQQLPHARKRTTAPTGTSSDQRPNRQFPASGNNNTTPESKRADQQSPKVQKSARDREPLLRQNAGIQSIEPRLSLSKKAKLKKEKRRSRRIARKVRGRTMARAPRKRFMRMQSGIMSSSQEGTAISNAQKRAAAGNSSETISGLEVGDATPPAVKRKRQRFQSQLHQSGKGPVQEESDAFKRIRARDQSLKIKNHVQPVLPDYPNQVAIMAAGNADAAEFVLPAAEHMAEKHARAYEKSKKISQAHVGYGGVNLEARKAREHQTSLLLANTEGKRLVPDRAAQMALARRQSLKYSQAEVGNTMIRPEYKEMLKEKSAKISRSTKGNTMGREEYKAMLKRKSEKFATAEKGNTLRREAHVSMMRAKSDDIVNFEAGYLNTKAEKRARIRSFFHPDEFVANTPKEQRAKARDVSGDIAGFHGKKRRHKIEVKNAHASSQAENSKRNIRSYESRESTRKRTAFLMRWNRKRLIPVWMKKKEKKAKYDDVERGLWND